MAADQGFGCAHPFILNNHRHLTWKDVHLGYECAYYHVIIRMQETAGGEQSMMKH